jgi:two-component system NarL family sensor kinase
VLPRGSKRDRIALVTSLPQAVGRASLAIIALFDLGALLLAVHSPSLASIAAAAIGPVFFVVPAVGAYVGARRPRNPLGWIFLTAGVALAVWAFAGSYGYAALSRGESLPAAGLFAWLESWLWVWSVPLIAGFGVLLFPDGHLPSRRWRPVLWLACLMLAVLTLGLAFSTEYFDWSRPNPLAAPFGLDVVATNVYGPGLLLMFPVAALTTWSLVGRMRRAQGEDRRVLRAATAPAAMVAVTYIGCIAFAVAGGNTIVVFAFECIGVVGLAVTTAIGVVRYGLFDLRVAVNRTAVYGALTALVIGLYLGVSSAVGLITSGAASAIVAGAAVALAALPLRDLLQRSVNRLLYGDRDDPYLAISRLANRLDAVAETTDVLPAVVRTVGECLRLPYVAVELRGELAAEHGRPGLGETHELPLGFQGEQLGRLLCETRRPGETFAAADIRLLHELSHHVAVAAREVLLTSDLVRSREQLVLAREEERRRIRRDLHDGLGPSLAGIALGIDSARRSLRDDPEQADRELDDLRQAARDSVVEIRRIAHDLRPPALDELGLVGALRAQVQRLGGSIDAPDELPELSAAIEVGAYRIALEALANATRHARASDCRIRLSIDAGLRVEVEDDGVGLPEAYEPGIGMASIHERARELGGSLVVERLVPTGTRVLAILPLGA